MRSTKYERPGNNDYDYATAPDYQYANSLYTKPNTRHWFWTPTDE